MIIEFVQNREEAQALADFLWNEKKRHEEDIANIDADLEQLKVKWWVEPRGIKRFVKP
jgi:hypothetical protein